MHAKQGAGIAFALATALLIASGEAAYAEKSPGTRGVEVLRPTAKPPAPAPTPTPSLQPAPRTCPRPIAGTDLTLRPNDRPAAFDTALRSRLQARAPRVTIDMANPFALGTEGPPPLSAWLTEAKAKGGIVSVDQYCEAPRGLFGWLRKVFGGGAQSGYDAVDGYDAILHADGANGVVTQVEFRLRTGA